MRYVPRFIKPPKESFFLFGPRGTGKSTWIRHSFDQLILVNLLDAEEERRYLAKPERLREVIAARGEKKICVVDEVQRVPSILPIVHDLIEEKCGVQFILTGSSARKLRRSASDLLAGRALLRHMHPFLASELGQKFSLERALRIGLIPLIWDSDDGAERLQAYVTLYLKEEVQAEGLVRQIGDFARFMEVASFSHAGLLNTTQIARDAHVKRQTIDNYISILEDLLLAFRVSAFTHRAKRAVVTHSKFYFFDPGVFRSLRPVGPMDREAELEGPALEGLVAQHLHAWILAQESSHQLAFWRTRTGLEVDFVVYGRRGFWGIEVKRAADLSPSDVKGLRAFQEEYSEARILLVYGGKVPIVYHDVPCVPVEQFLLSLRPDGPVFST